MRSSHLRTLLPAALAVLPLISSSCLRDGGGSAEAEIVRDTASPEPPRALSASPAIADPYDFARPAASFQLAGRLREISGIDVVDSGRLAAVADEDGIVYVIDAATGKVVSEHEFGKKGDYEDLAFVGDELFVLRSDGQLFEIEDWDEKKPDKVKSREADVPRGCDAEGLALTPDRRSLLIACKERAGKGMKDGRAFYAYDLHEKKLQDDPSFVLAIRDLEASLGRSARDFKPAAARFHPVTHELYVLSSVTTAMAVLRPNGTLRAAYPLSKALLPQPEGLAFLPGGDLFISSEGAGGDGSLHRFTYRPGN